MWQDFSAARKDLAGPHWACEAPEHWLKVTGWRALGGIWDSEWAQGGEQGAKGVPTGRARGRTSSVGVGTRPC